MAKLAAGARLARDGGAEGRQGRPARQAERPARGRERLLHRPWRRVGVAGPALHRPDRDADRGRVGRMAAGQKSRTSRWPRSPSRRSRRPRPTPARPPTTGSPSAPGTASPRTGRWARSCEFAQAVYEASKTFRAANNRCPIHEPGLFDTDGRLIAAGKGATRSGRLPAPQRQAARSRAPRSIGLHRRRCGERGSRIRSGHACPGAPPVARRARSGRASRPAGTG